MKNTQCDKCGLQASEHIRVNFFEDKDVDHIEIKKNTIPMVDVSHHSMELCKICYNEFMSKFHDSRSKWKNASV